MASQETKNREAMDRVAAKFREQSAQNGGRPMTQEQARDRVRNAVRREEARTGRRIDQDQ